MFRLAIKRLAVNVTTTYHKRTTSGHAYKIFNHCRKNSRRAMFTARRKQLAVKVATAFQQTSQGK